MHPPELADVLSSEPALLAAALAVGAADVPGWSEAERIVAAEAPALRHRRAVHKALTEAARDGLDPLGDAFCRLRTPETRRHDGATYTPPPIIASMIDWAASQSPPVRIVDPGAGSGRFAVAAGRRFGRSELIAVESDPIAAIICRANLALAGLAERSRVIAGNYLYEDVGGGDGKTLYLGNPPYVRHHQIPQGWKEWLALTARSHDLDASRLAGLHVHFFLATAHRARAGDEGAFVTSSEWLDTNYGRLVRELLLGLLGGESIHVIEPTTAAFDDASVTATITCFSVGRAPGAIRMRRIGSVSELGSLDGGIPVPRASLAEASRWSPLTRRHQGRPADYIELGEICRVRRGAVTGQNSTWVVRPGEADLPDEVLYPCITRAREIFDAGESLSRTDHLKLVVDLPRDLEGFEEDDYRRIRRFLAQARKNGAHDGYIARTRPKWYSVGLREPAPILATYMARRPPAFTRNVAGARNINIAHGLYPRFELTEPVIRRLVAALSEGVTVADGRTYSGGLTKFEPREMERLPIPNPLEAEVHA